MKKFAIMTLTALTLTCLGGQTITAQAAFHKQGNVIYAYSTGCNLSEILNKLESCRPGNSGANKPGSCQPGTGTPETEAPDNNIPEVDIPGTNEPETEVPDSNTPEVNLPGTNEPETEMPDSNTPETNLPGTNQPETDQPGTNTPETETPDTNIPEINLPGTNEPETEIPETPGTNESETETPDTDTPSNDQTSSSDHAFIQQVVDLVNEERAKEGLSPLTINTRVQAAAQVRAQECEQQFSHTRPDGTSFSTALKEQNVSYRSAGENIAWGQRSPQEVMNAWMNSSGHRANIMNANFTTIGVGYYQNANGTGYWCQLFTR